MKIIGWILGVVVGLVVAFMALIYGASELGGEVVTLTRAEADGSTSRVRLWIVDEGDSAWIQHGAPDAYWLTALGEGGQLSLERDGAIRVYKATPDAGACARYHELRRQKYGLADEIVGLLSPSGATCQGVPVRLEQP